ncbi:MAG: right-handed parallel beta-helix repeat-containing protein, partial [Promethearchaeota archaeon]
MKLNKKNKIIIIFSLFLLSLFINTQYFHNKHLSKYNSDYSNLRVAQFSSKIHINNNWSWTAGNYSWCTGSGTLSDPYVIADLIIDGGNSGSCIFIQNTIDYFIIRNCTVYNSGSNWKAPFIDAGILMYSVCNGTLINNNCSFNQNGIYMDLCDNNTILGNNFTFNDETGLFLTSDSSNNKILQNTINNNKDTGIKYLGSGGWNNISGNIISSNNVDGIVLSGCNSNTISDNTCDKNGENGIHIGNMWETPNNTIKNNTITNNGRNGIYSFGSNNNSIKENRINNNKMHGISLEASNNFSIISNNINFNFIGGIFINYSFNITILTNAMKGCGLVLSGNIDDLSSHKIDRNNTINNKPVYYYVNKSQLNYSNFTIDGKSPGQVILVECNNTKISDFNLYNTSIGFALHYCRNISISNNIVSNNTINGIYSKSCNNLTISGNNLTYNPIGIYLDMCHNSSVLSNNASFNYENAMYLEDCNNSLISENIAINNTESGIFLRYCDYNNITKNIAINNSIGICLDESHYNNVLDNNASYNVARNLSIDFNLGQGIYLKSSDYNNLSLNKLESNTFAGIYLHEINNITITENRMDKCGLFISLEDPISPLYEIDTSNLVNDKPLYYYYNKKALNINKSTNAGQVLLINCSQSIISNLNLSYCTAGMMLWNCSDNFIFNNSASFNYIGGILLECYCYNNSLFKNNATDCGQIVISIDTNDNQCGPTAIGINRGDNNNITHCIVENSLNGIFISDCNNTIIFNNTGNNNFLAGIYVLGSSSRIKNIQLKDNVMKKCGLAVFAPNIDENTFIIDDSNSVNEKQLYYYFNEDNLNPSDFSDPGQIFLFNSSNTIISNVDVSNASAGIILYNCINNSFYNVTSTYNNFCGFFMAFSNNCTFFNNNINNNYLGIVSLASNNFSMFANKFEDNAEGLNMHYSNNFTIYNNSF